MRIVYDAVRAAKKLIYLCIVMVFSAGIVSADEDAVVMRVKGLLTQKCLSCHSGDDAKGKLNVSTREGLIKGGESGGGLFAGSPNTSPLWQRIQADEMPPKHPLSDDEKLIVHQWILSGAKWTGGELDPLAVTSDHRAGMDWWSLQPLRPVEIPQLKTNASRHQPIDDFIVEKLSERRISPSPEADRRVLIRRVSFDLLGLPPTPEDVVEFETDNRADAYERLTDRLLASPHYGEHWARHWLDVVRFGESHGFERDLPRPNAWPYRDWVVAALNRDLPYDEFVRWQLAGDLIAPDNTEALQSVGFLVAGPHDTVVPAVDRMRAMMRQDELEDIVGTVGQSFLGMTVNCARCHDHKFDPITSREYYQLASAVSGVDHGEREFIPPEVRRQLATWQTRIEELTKLLRDQETPIRTSILAERTTNGRSSSPTKFGPSPISAWDFTKDLNDQVGDLHVTLAKTATRSADGLVVNGSSYAKTSSIKQNLLEKTFEVRVRLKSLAQAGGGAISLQTLDGNLFDAIVFGELEAAQWMAGSNGYQRTQSYQAPAETIADREAVVMTQVHRADGTIVAYRNGLPYGRPIRKDSAIEFQRGSAQVIFGLRHGTDIGGNRMLDGVIVNAKLYDKALTAEEVAISADTTNTFVAESEIAARLPQDEQQIRQARRDELIQLRKNHDELSKNGPVKIYTAIATQPPPMKVHQRGSVSALGEEVEPAGLAAIRGLPAQFDLRPDAIESHRRMRLANWITDSRNALFGRVMTNRVWHYHFGTGLVETPNDLGFHAGMPSHPELLEWLTAEFTGEHDRSRVGSDSQSSSHRYGLKHLHRVIIKSATYRQSSRADPVAAKIDANNRLLWRMNPRRLEAESVRDAMLVVAGELNTEIGGRGYLDVNSYFFKGTQFYEPIDPVGYPFQRRTLYRMSARSGRSPFLDTFDCPDPSTTTPRRSATVTPLQALSLLNHSFSLRMAEQFAQRLSHDTPQASDVPVTDTQIRVAYKLLFGRVPDREELRLGRGLIARRGLPEFCRAMWNSSEFLYVD